jgi:hypothetical protein
MAMDTTTQDSPEMENLHMVEMSLRSLSYPSQEYTSTLVLRQCYYIANNTGTKQGICKEGLRITTRVFDFSGAVRTKNR